MLFVSSQSIFTVAGLPLKNVKNKHYFFNILGNYENVFWLF